MLSTKSPILNTIVICSKRRSATLFPETAICSLIASSKLRAGSSTAAMRRCRFSTLRAPINNVTTSWMFFQGVVNAYVNLRRNNFDPLRIFFLLLTNYRVLSSVCPATRADQDRPPHPAAGRLHLDILWWTAGAETSERGVYRRAFRARSSRLPSLPQVSR